MAPRWLLRDPCTAGKRFRTPGRSSRRTRTALGVHAGGDSREAPGVARPSGRMLAA